MKLTRERFKGNSKAEKNNTNSVESLIRILDVFKDYAVQCFFSYEADDSTTPVNALATEGIEKYETRCASLIGKPFSEFAIPCLPNFTIIPKDKSGVILDRRMVINDDVVELSKEKEDIMKLWIDGVYVGAAYVAAGIVAAYQCPEYIKDKFGKAKIDMELPGEAGLTLRLTTIIWLPAPLWQRKSPVLPIPLKRILTGKTSGLCSAPKMRFTRETTSRISWFIRQGT